MDTEERVELVTKAISKSASMYKENSQEEKTEEITEGLEVKTSDLFSNRQDD